MQEIKKTVIIDTKTSERSIKSLRSEISKLNAELEETTVGSADFDIKLEQLGRLQKEYTAINEEIINSSKPVKKEMFELARFGENLAKSYSAINAVVGLFADGNEDLQKSLLKTAQMIQLIQGLSGFAPMLRDLPKLIDGFKQWTKILDPISNRINNIATRLSNLAVDKLSVGGGSATATATSVVKQTQDQVSAQEGYEQQIVAVNSQLTNQYEKLKVLQSARDDEIKYYNQIQEEYSELKEDLLRYNELTKRQIEIFNQRTTGTTLSRRKSKQLFQESLNIYKEQTNIVRKYGNTLEEVQNKAADYVKILNDSEAAVSKQTESIAEVEKQIRKLEKSMTSVSGKARNFFKNILATAGWTLLITAIVAATGALIKWVSNLKTAAGAQRALNKEIGQNAASEAAKTIITLKELARRYREVGDSAAEKTKFLEDYKDEIAETGLKIRDINTADDAFINNTSKYIDALNKRAKAQAIENLMVQEYQKYLENVAKKQATRRYERVEQTRQLGEDIGLPPEQVEMIGQDERIVKRINKLTADVEQKLDWLSDKAESLREETNDLFIDPIADATAAEAKAALERSVEQRKAELDQLKEFYSQARKLFMDNESREIAEIEEKYAEQIELAKKLNGDIVLLEKAKELEIKDIRDKYNAERLRELEESINAEYDLIQKQIDRIRRMNDTSNLAIPQSQSYLTEYTQRFGEVFMAGNRFFYQSAENLQAEYDAQIAYNNQLLELTKSRITQENELLNQQLEIVGLDADRRLEIQRTLAENEIALSDASLKNEADNANAYITLQDKKNQALQSTLSVASDVFGSMATILGEQTKAGKAFAVAQAVMDTYSAANSAYSAMSGIPVVGPALGAAAAAAAVIAGIANVKNILSTDVSGASTSVSISGTSTAPPPALEQMPIEYSRQLLGNRETDELNKPTRVYVLESDITSAQNRVRVAESNSSF